MIVGFNPRTRVGCDLHSTVLCPAATSVSIHAPAWGATHRPAQHRPPRDSFNPRTRVGCDWPCKKEKDMSKVSIHAPAWGATGARPPARPWRRKFQSTHPRGVRPMPPPQGKARAVCFNPRTRVGCDGTPTFQILCCWCFNPRTRVGCDGMFPIVFSGRIGFQSTHPRGVRRPYC